MEQIKKIVEQCLANSEQARNDDYILYLEVCKMKGINLDVSAEEYFRNRKRYPSYDGISRTRRKIQENGLYLATQTTRQKRLKNEERYRAEFA